MSPRMPESRRFPSKALLAGATLAAAALLLWWLRPSEASDGAPPAPVATRTPVAAPIEEARPPAPAVAPTASEPVVARPAPVIDELTVEKKEVCSGEENLVTIKAHTVDGTDDHLHYAVGSETGQRIPLRLWKHPDGSFERPTVSVFGRDNVVTHAPLPAFEVKDCEPLRNALVRSRLLPNTLGEYEFQVRIADVAARTLPDAKPFQAVRYVWDWGDGSTETTEVPVATHRFSGQDLERMYHQYLVSVEAVSAQGERVGGRHALQVLNLAYENFVYRGVVTVLGEGTPRFPKMGEDGVVRQTFRLFHQSRGPVRIDKVTAVRLLGPTKEEPSREEARETNELAVGLIPSGPGVEVQVKLDTKAEPDTAVLTFQLEGTSADGHPARGSFSVMRPPDLPTKEKHVPVMDPVLIAKIKRAQQLLQQRFVTDEDLIRLEREGKFADLKVDGKPIQGG